MTEIERIASYLDPLRLDDWKYTPETGSTNDDALAWADAGAGDWSLICADSQTAGRGRGKRRWVTLPGTALAFSLVLRPTQAETSVFPRFTALAALGLVQALGSLGLQGQIKWPNDILLNQKKVAGVLVEASWQGTNAEAVVIGLGVNITPDGVPAPETTRYPAASVGRELGRDVDRWALLFDILKNMQSLRKDLAGQDFLNRWNEHLAFKNQWVNFRMQGKDPQRFKVLGVKSDSQLSLLMEDGSMITAAAGEILPENGTKQRYWDDD